MDSIPGWMEGTDEPAMAVIASNDLSRMTRRANQITEEVTKIKQRVDRMIQTFERTHSVFSGRQSPDMEILENMDDLENVLHDQKKKYQQKLTVFIVGYQETCGQRTHLLTQLQEFFSIYANMNEEERDHQLGQSTMDLDGIANQVTGAVRSAEAAMSRLADIHTGIMSYVSQTISVGAQGKWKSSNDRGRKKLEKVLEQARQDIVQLTDQLLQAKEDIILKDQQMKELLKQNETRILEIQHFKSQLEVTKRSLQTLHDETAIQRSLLEAELRRQAGRLEELNSQEALKGEQLTDASTQWESLDYIFQDDEGVIPAASEEEKNILDDSMETTERTVLTEFIDEHSDAQNSELEFNAIDIGIAVTENVSQPESLECIIPSLLVFEERISGITLSPMVEENNSVITPVNVEEKCNTITSLPLSENSKPSSTPPPNISAIQLSHMSEVESQHIDANDGEMYPATSCADPQETPPCVSQENMTSHEDTFNHLILPPVTEEKDLSTIAHPVSEEITDTCLTLPLPSSGSNVTTSCHEPDKTNHLILTVPAAGKYTSPITAILLTDERPQSSQPDISNTLFQVPEKSTSPITLLKLDEGRNHVTSIHITNRDTHLMMSPSDIKKNFDFPPPYILDENIHISFPAVNTMAELSPSYENDEFTTSISDPDQYGPDSISIPVPDKDTLHLTSLPILDKTTELITSLSVPSDSIHLFTSLPLNSVNSHMDENIQTQPSETNEEEVTPKQNVGSLLSSCTADINQPAEPPMLCEDLAEREIKKREWMFHTDQGEVSAVESLDSGNHHEKLWGVSQRLHKCVQEIRNLLITEGFHSLSDDLTEGVQDNNGDVISKNLTQLENFQAVLHSLLHTITRKSTEPKQLTDEHSQDVGVTNENKRTEKNSPLLLIYREDENGDDPLINAPLSHDSGNTCSLIFTSLDEEHNRRVLQRARYQGKIPIHLYQDASRVMTEYRTMRQERLRALVWEYVLYISWKRAENLLQKQCLLRPQVTPTLTKLQQLKHQVFLRRKEKMAQSQEERLSLSAALDQTLRGVQEESGIFLIKPVISWPGRSSVLKTRKQIHVHYKTLRRPCFPPLDQGGVLCCSRVPSNVPKEWKTIDTHTELRPLVITPKLLEMDVHRYLCKESCVMSQLHDSSTELPLKTSSPQKNFVSVKRTPPFPAL